jgi:hypothetical protein
MIDQEERAAVGLDNLRSGLDDQAQQPVQVALRDQRLSGLEDSGELAKSLLLTIHGGGV